MRPNETTEQKLTRVSQELGAALRERARGRWNQLRTAKRKVENGYVWRFRTGGGDPDRFIRFSRTAMTNGENPTAELLAQLDQARWLDRMQAGPETSFMLASNGRLRGRSVD